MAFPGRHWNEPSVLPTAFAAVLAVPEGGNHAQQQQLAELKQPVLKAAGNADAQNLLDFARMPLEGEHARIRNPAVRVAEGTLRDVRAHGARNQRRQPRAHHAPAQPEDSHAVADEVDDVHDEGGEHRCARIANAAQERAVGIVNRHDG